MGGRRALVGLATALAVALVAWWLGGTATDSTPRSEPAPTVTATAGERPSAPPAGTAPGRRGLRRIAVSDLPPEARETLDLIESGGPFPYDRDGARFENRERLLPEAPRGYYHEYTVETPGSDDRGARRIVTGSRGERFYTDDHYASFREVVR